MLSRRAIVFGGAVSIASSRQSSAQFASSAISSVDPYIMPEIRGSEGDRDTNADTLSSQSLNAGLKNCILIVAGQSNVSNVVTSLYVPTNTGKVDNLNPYDGAVYAYKDPLMGCSGLAGGGTRGNFAGRLADKLINAGKFDRVIIVPVGVFGTTAAQWETSLNQRIIAAMRRCAYRGMTPTAILWGQGEQDNFVGTGQSAYQASLTNVINATKSAGFAGPWFVAEQTWNAGLTSAAIQAAQAAVVNHSVSIWAGPNADSLNATNRQADNTHWNDTGADAYAGLWQTALAAFGAPF